MAPINKGRQAHFPAPDAESIMSPSPHGLWFREMGWHASFLSSTINPPMIVAMAAYGTINPLMIVAMTSYGAICRPIEAKILPQAGWERATLYENLIFLCVSKKHRLLTNLFTTPSRLLTSIGSSMEAKENSMSSSIVELIWQLRLEVSLDLRELMKQAREALEKPTSSPEELRRKVKLLLSLKQRMQENQDLIKCLAHYIEAARTTTTDAQSDGDDDAAADNGAQHFGDGGDDDTADFVSMEPDVKHVGIIKEFGLDIDDVLAVLSTDDEISSAVSSTESRITSAVEDAKVPCGARMYWPVEWRDVDPSQLGWWIDLSDYEPNVSAHDILETTGVSGNDDCSSADSKAVWLNSTKTVQQYGPKTFADVMSRNGSLSDEVNDMITTSRERENDSIGAENCCGSMKGRAASSIECHQTWAQIASKSRRREASILGSSIASKTLSKKGADYEFQLVGTACRRWRRRRQGFEMKAKQYLEGRMPLPTFNYFHVLDDIDVQEMHEENPEMVAVASKKWRKHQHMFERKADEWLHDDDSIPIANMYIALRDAFLSESSSCSDDDDNDEKIPDNSSLTLL